MTSITHISAVLVTERGSSVLALFFYYWAAQMITLLSGERWSLNL